MTRSLELLERAERLIPGASQTLSKGPSQWVQAAPRYLEDGRGAYVWDVDGNQYLDYGMGLGPVILGYRHLVVDYAIQNQMDDCGITFTLPHRLEVEVAERINAMVPGAERVRFAKTGSDACSAAVRLARIFTGRDHVIATGYHGGHDWYMASSAYAAGIPDEMRYWVTPTRLDRFDYIETVLWSAPPTACIILEPAGTYVPTSQQLQEIVDLAHKHGALVVFDEVVTGFRLARGGAQEYFGVQADLAAFGKALGNGMPISAVAGRADVMANVMFLSYTHAGECLSLAAAAATLDELTSEPVHEHLWALGEGLKSGIIEAIRSHGLEDWVTCSGLAPRTIVTVKEPTNDGKLWAKSLIQQELVRRGILWNGNNCISYSHTASDIATTVDAWDEALDVLAGALPDDVVSRVDGPPITRVFWQNRR